MFLRFIRVVVCVSTSFFLWWLSNSLSYVYITLFFLRASTDGHLDCFHLLALGSSVTVNVCVQVSESLFSVLLGLYLGVELLRHMVVLCLTF